MIKTEIKENGQFKVGIEGSEEDLMLETLCIVKALSVFSDTDTKTILDFIQKTLKEKEQEKRS